LKTFSTILIGFTALTTAGCGTLITDTYQNVTIETDPPGASCQVTRDGDPVNSLTNTPGVIHIDKSKNNLVVECRKAGYQPATATDTASIQGWFFGNFAVDGAAFLLDVENGGYVKYHPHIMMTLTPLQSGPPAAPQLLAPAAASWRNFGIGVAPVDRASAVAQGLAIDAGVQVTQVLDGSAAARSGITVGDVLVSIDGEPVRQKGDIRRVLDGRPAGSIVSVHLVRNGAPLDVAAQI
jgi:hypothetical protein